MNKQDREDFEQDFAVCVLVGKYTPTQVEAYRGFYCRSHALALAIKVNRHLRLNTTYAQHLEHTRGPENEKLEKEELIFKVLELLNNVPSKQRKAILAFLETGDLKKAAAKLSQNYNTTKANFRFGVIALRSMING